MTDPLVEIKELPEDKRSRISDPSTLVFGRTFSDHMFTLHYADAHWETKGHVEPLHMLPMHPGALVFHYAQEGFEGLKAFHVKGGRICLFRPDRNIARMNLTCRRMVMPEINPAMFLAGLKSLVRTDRRHVPSVAGTSFYLRPTIIGTEAILGVRPSSEYLFYIIACPVGSYNPEGLAPTKLLVQREYTRAAPGGTGAVKCGGNYAASLIAGDAAKKKGCSQVLWLDAIEHKYVEEAGGMNVFFVINGKVTTAPLRGTILPGITRDSILEICRDLRIPAEERVLSMDEIVEGINNRTLTEIFECGTAASISPVGELIYEDRHLVVADGGVGHLTRQLYDHLVGIQRGEVPDLHGWIVDIDA